MKTIRRLVGAVIAPLCVFCLLMIFCAGVTTSGNVTQPAIGGYAFTGSVAETVTPANGSATNNSTKGGETSVSFDGNNAFTLTAKSAYSYEDGVLLWKTTYYAQHYAVTLKLTNNSGSVLELTYSATGVDSGTENGKRVTLENGASLSFTVTARAASDTATESTTATGTLKITEIAEVKGVEVTFEPSASGSYSYEFGGSSGTIAINGERSDTISATAGSSVTLTQGTTAAGYTFYGWMASGSLLGTSDGTYVVNKSASIYPVYLPTETVSKGAAFTVGSNSHMFWHLAVEDARNTGNAIVLARDYTLPATMEENGLLAGHDYEDYVRVVDGKLEYVVPSGVTFLVPYDDAGTLYKNGTGKATKNTTSPAVFRSLIVPSDTTVRVSGEFEVGSRQFATSNQNTGRQIGAYGLVKTESNGSVVIDSGTLYCWGYIIGDGTVSVSESGTVYEMLQIRDWRGGSITSTMSLNNSRKVFPFSQYYVQNVEVPMTLNAGAKEYLVFSVEAGLGSSKDIYEITDALLIGDADDDALFRLVSGTLTKEYDAANDRIICTVDGGGSVNIYGLNVTVSASGQSMDLDSSKYVLPLPGHFTIKVESGSNISLTQDITLLPGSEIKIAPDAAMTIAEGKSVFVYDLSEWEGEKFAYTADFYQVLYSPSWANGKAPSRTLKDAVIDVNGTLTVNGQLYTTESGANICSTKGTGKVVLNTTPSASGVKHYQLANNEISLLSNGYTEITITPAKLLNTNTDYATYTEAARAQSGDVFTYHDDMWGVAVIVNATDIYAGGYANVQRAAEYFVNADTTGDYVKLLADASGDVSVTGKLVLDLAGHTLTGNVSATTFYGFDTSGGYTLSGHTAEYTEPKGKIVGSVTNLEKTYKTPTAADNSFERYVAITDGNTTTFHRFNISVTGFRVLLSKQADNSYAATIFYSAVARGDETVKGAVEEYGFKFTDSTDVDKRYTSTEPITFDKEFESTIGWGGIVDESNVKTEYGAKAYLTFANGGTQESVGQSHSLFELLAIAYNHDKTSTEKMLSLPNGGSTRTPQDILDEAMGELGLTSEWYAATGRTVA